MVLRRDFVTPCPQWKGVCLGPDCFNRQITHFTLNDYGNEIHFANLLLFQFCMKVGGPWGKGKRMTLSLTFACFRSSNKSFHNIEDMWSMNQKRKSAGNFFELSLPNGLACWSNNSLISDIKIISSNKKVDTVSIWSWIGWNFSIFYSYFLRIPVSD